MKFWRQISALSIRQVSQLSIIGFTFIFLIDISWLIVNEYSLELTDFGKILITGLITTGINLISNYLAYRNKTKEIKLTAFHKETSEALKTLYYLTSELLHSIAELNSLEMNTLTLNTYKHFLKNCLDKNDELLKFYLKTKLIVFDSNNPISIKIFEGIEKMRFLRSPILIEYRKWTETGELQIPIEAITTFKSIEEENESIKKSYSELLDNFGDSYADKLIDLIEDIEMYYKTLSK